MPEIITAVYENGILRPLRPLAFQERQTVRLQVLPDAPVEEVEEVIRLMVSAGLMRSPQLKTPRPLDPVSTEERRKLAEILGQAPGKSLSEIIIEERDWL